MRRGVIVAVVGYEAQAGGGFYQTERHVISRLKGTFDNTQDHGVNAAVGLILLKDAGVHGGTEVGRSSSVSPTPELRSVLEDWAFKNGGVVAS